MANAITQLATAQVFDLADWRKARTVAGAKPQALPAFNPDPERPGMDLNRIGRGLETLAHTLRAGKLSQDELGWWLDGLAVNALAACRAGHDLESNLLNAHRLLADLDPALADLEGKALHRAIREKVKANQAARYWAKRKGGKPSKGPVSKMAKAGDKPGKISRR